MYKCFIVDDEYHAIETLHGYAIESGQLEIAGTSQNPLEAIKYINTHKDVDITFLDIDMPGISGLDAADLISHNTAVIFTTGHPGYAVQGFDKNISDFLLKPISFQRFMKALTKVTLQLEERKNQLERQNDTFFFVNPGIKGKMIKVDYEDVVYIEGLNNYVVIHTTQQDHIVYLTMKDMENGMPAKHFIRIHKSFIVNLKRVSLMEGNKMIMDKLVLPIGSSFKDKVLQKVNSYMIRTLR